jgi:hypothetical protein
MMTAASILPSSRGVAQSGSASGLGPEGRRFESYRPDQFFFENPKAKSQNPMNLNN